MSHTDLEQRGHAYLETICYQIKLYEHWAKQMKQETTIKALYKLTASVLAFPSSNAREWCDHTAKLTHRIGIRKDTANQGYFINLENRERSRSEFSGKNKE